jgi:hypothetical protein
LKANEFTIVSSLVIKDVKENFCFDFERDDAAIDWFVNLSGDLG